MKKLLLTFALLKIFILASGQITIKDHNRAVEFVNQAQTMFTDNQYDDAKIALESAIKLDSTIREAYVLMYQADYYSGKAALALPYLMKSKSIFAEDDEIAYYLGKIYQSERRYDDAIMELSEAIKFGKINGEDFPIVHEYYASRGACYLIQNKYQEALSDFNYSIKLNNNIGGVYANRGIALYQLQEYDQACENWKMASKLGETSVISYIEKHCN